MRLHPSWHHPHLPSKLTQTGACGLQWAPSRAVGTGGHQGHLEAAAKRYRIGMGIHTHGDARRLSGLPMPSPQRHRRARCRRHQPGMGPWPATMGTVLLPGRQGLVESRQSFCPVGDDDQALMGRASLQCQQASHPAGTAGITTQTKHRLGGIGNQSAASQVGAQGTGGFMESLHGDSVPNGGQTVRIKP